MSTPPPDQSTDLRAIWGWVAAIGTALGIAARVFWKALRKAEDLPDVLTESTDPATVLHIERAIAEINRKIADNTKTIGVMQESMDTHFAILPSQSKRLTELELATDENQRRWERFQAALDEVKRVQAAGFRKILDTLAQMGGATGE